MLVLGSVNSPLTTQKSNKGQFFFFVILQFDSICFEFNTCDGSNTVDSSEIRRENPPGIRLKKKRKSWDTLPTSSGFPAGFLTHQNRITIRAMVKSPYILGMAIPPLMTESLFHGALFSPLRTWVDDHPGCIWK